MFTQQTASGGGGTLVRIVLALTLLVLLAVTLFSLLDRPGDDDSVTVYSGGTSLPTLEDRRNVEQQWLDSIS